MAHQGHLYHRPENVLKHAEDFMSINKDEQALQLLFGLLSQSRNKVFQPAHEDLMKKFLELCVNSRDNRMAKEGLHRYRSLTIQNLNSLTAVIDYMLVLAESRAEKAAATCDSVILSDVEDLESEKSPESILLEVVTSDRSKKRNEYEHLLPWVRFLWESYRSVLDLLLNNNKMEACYHSTTQRAFAFCVKYERTNEFHKLCETLRMHMLRRRDEDMTPESVEMQLSTRFEQLKVSSQLRLWNDSFRVLDDIHNIFQRSEKRPSAQLEATYYQKLTDLFLVSKNYLFHAYAYNAYFMLSVEKNKGLTADQVKVMASCVLLSSMSIPLPSTKVGTTYAYRDAQKQKNHKMAQLLGFDINPNRKNILQELIDKDMLDDVSDHIRELYLLLECTFAPLDLVGKVVPIFEIIRTFAGQETLVHYIEPLENLLIIRVVSQLSHVFQTVTFETLEQLLTPLGKKWLNIENSIVQAIKHRQIDVYQVRIDHMAKCLRFGEDFVEEERTRLVLADLSRGLKTICAQLEPEAISNCELKQRRERAATVLNFLESTHMDVLRRKEVIDRRKADYARVIQSRRADAERLREAKERQRRDLEISHAARQRELREKQMLEQLEEEKRRVEWKQKLLEQGVDVSSAAVVKLSTEEQAKLLEDTRRKALEQSLETMRRLQFSTKKLDTMVRIVRQKEIPLRKAEYAAYLAKIEKDSAEQWKDRLKFSEVEHKKAIKKKSEYAGMRLSCYEFRDKLMESWVKENEVERSKRWQKLDQKLKKEKLDRARATRQVNMAKIKFRKDEEERIQADKKRRAEEAKRLEEEPCDAGRNGHRMENTFLDTNDNQTADTSRQSKPDQGKEVYRPPAARKEYGSSVDRPERRNQFDGEQRRDGRQRDMRTGGESQSNMNWR